MSIVGHSFPRTVLIIVSIFLRRCPQCHQRVIQFPHGVQIYLLPSFVDIVKSGVELSVSCLP